MVQIIINTPLLSNYKKNEILISKKRNNLWIWPTEFYEIDDDEEWRIDIHSGAVDETVQE